MPGLTGQLGQTGRPGHQDKRKTAALSVSVALCLKARDLCGMALRVARPLRFRLTRLLRAGGADDAKPRWTLPEADYHKYTYQPSIPDKHFNIGHWNYAPITMWLRARRPAMERVIGDVYGTVLATSKALWAPISVRRSGVWRLFMSFPCEMRS